MTQVILLVYFLFFLLMIHFLFKYFTIIRTYIKYEKNGVVRYTILFSNTVIYDTINKVFDDEDRKIIFIIYLLNNFINMNIRIR